MFVKVYDIPVEILSFDEESSTIYTKQVPLSLRRFIRQILVERQKVNIEDYFIKTTVRVFNKLTERSLRGQSVDKIYTTPDSFIKYQTLLCVFYMDNPSLQIILLGK